MCLCVLFRGKEGPDLHADGLERVPRALPVHPDDAVVCSVLGHAFRVLSTPVVSPVRIGRVAGVVPPSATIFSRTLLCGVTR